MSYTLLSVEATSDCEHLVLHNRNAVSKDAVQSTSKFVSDLFGVPVVEKEKLDSSFTDLAVLLVVASLAARTPFDVCVAAAEDAVISAHAFFKRLLAHSAAESCDEVSDLSASELDLRAVLYICFASGLPDKPIPTPTTSSRGKFVLKQKAGVTIGTVLDQNVFALLLLAAQLVLLSRS